MPDFSDTTIKRPDRDVERDDIAAKQVRRGMLLKDRRSVSAMNRKYVPIRFKAPDSKGKIGVDGRTVDKLYSRERWDEFGSIMKEKISDITSRMRRGDISLAKPHGGAHCDTCKFNLICRKDS
jgi:hypothetical protein